MASRNKPSDVGIGAPQSGKSSAHSKLPPAPGGDLLDELIAGDIVAKLTPSKSKPVSAKPKVQPVAPNSTEQRSTTPKVQPTVPKGLAVGFKRAIEVNKERAKLRAEASKVSEQFVAERKLINLDTRVKTTKTKKVDEQWSGANRKIARDTFFGQQVVEARKKFGDDVMLGSETDKLVIGIPCPALAFEYVTGQDCFLLGIIIQLVGKTGLGKSAMLAEFGRWFDMAGGGMYLCEAEDKFNPAWYESILGPEVFGRMPLYRCSSVEDWQRKNTASIKSLQRAMIGTKEEPGPGRTIPVLGGVDSITGKQSEETMEKILGEIGKSGLRGTTGTGHATRGHPVEAQVITRYMRTIPSLLKNWPFTLVLVNHLRIKKDDAGNTERVKTGGDQVGFQESLELELRKIGGHKKMIRCSEFTGFPVELSCEKSSFGETHRRAQTRILWRHEQNQKTGEWHQRTVIDWDWSTVHLLNSIANGEKSDPLQRKALQAIDFHIDCPSAGDVENKAWSRTLGMKAKDALSWAEVGAMIRENEDLMVELRGALRIKRRPWLAGEYMEQLAKIKQAMP